MNALSKRVIGVDPDMHKSAWFEVTIRPNGLIEPEHCGIWSVSRELAGVGAILRLSSVIYRERTLNIHRFTPDVAVIEGQQVYRGKTNPVSIMYLAQAAGLILGGFAPNSFTRLRMPTPNEWKGSVPKQIHQARVAKKLGWSGKVRGGKDPYFVPDVPRPLQERWGKINPGDWKHLMDAAGLAIWGAEQLMKGK